LIIDATEYSHVADITAAEIFAANQTSGFMADARVAFVLKYSRLPHNLLSKGNMGLNKESPANC